MTIKDMIEKRAKVWETAKNFVDTHENENGVLSAEDNATYSRMEQEIEDLTAAIDRQQRAEAREAALNQPINTPLTGRPAKQVEEKTGRVSNAYKEDFGAHLRGKRLVHNVLSEGVQADGGYLVPEEFERQIVTGLDEANVVRGLAKVITTSAERKIPVAATHSTAQWTAENGAYTESGPTFDQKTIDAFKLTDLVKVSIELLHDSMFDLESYIAGEFARAFGIAEEEAFCVGTGTGQPTGIFTANGGTVGVTAASATAITADELIKDVTFRASAAIPRIYRNKFHRDIYKDLHDLQKSIDENDPENSALDSFSLELFEDISYIMAKHADPQGVPDTPDEWLDQFGTFSIYQVLPEIIELWGLNVQTQVESKKTSSD